MTLTLLLDLDDTLLDTHLESFVPAYFQALSSHMAKVVSPNIMLPALIASTRLMTESEDPTRTLQEVFDAEFYARLGIPKEELTELIEQFYDEIFPELRVHTQPRPGAVSLIEWAQARGYRIAIATDPLFPCKATSQRLRWAGFDPDQFELVSTYEHFHFSKTHSAYYAEMLGRLGWQDGPVLMVGNDVNRDMIPAQRLGLKTYLVDEDSASGPGNEAGRGKLEDLRPWLESVDLSTLEPSFRSREAIMAILLSTPAVLRGLSFGLSEEAWRHEPAREDWALNEIVCHLRDTEREVHQVQLKLMIQQADAFLPRPDAAVWASERNYSHEEGPVALSAFAAARLETLEILKKTDEEIWHRRARHAIFGPTNFLEVVGFIADHDRLHIQQAWKTLQSV